MARKFNETKKITTVVYLLNGRRAAATFPDHLTASEIERQMLFQRHIPLRLIIGSEHKFI